MPEIISNVSIFLAVGISFLCIVPYIRDILKGSTKPHMYTWLVWFISQGVGFYVTYISGAGLASTVIFFAFLGTFIIFLLSFKYGTKNITKFDAVCMLVALLAIVFYLILANPVYSLLLAVAADVIAYFPTLRKVYQEPETETLSFYYLSIVAHIITLLNISVLNFNNSFFSASMIVINLFTCALILYARRAIKVKKNVV